MHDPFPLCSHQPVEHIAMHNQIALAIPSFMNRTVSHGDITEHKPELQEPSQKFIMIANDVGHTVPRLAAVRMRRMTLVCT